MAAIQRLIDLRSDTVTKPTAEMRAAMAAAEVGDDVFCDDPTVNALEARAAEMFGKEAALFVTSGTQGNLIAVIAHCGEFGSEYVAGADSHMVFYEQGGSATLGGVHVRTVANATDGTMALADIAAALRPDDVHFPVTRMVAVEQTHNRAGGRVLPLEYMDAVGALAHAHGIVLHVDGARLCNACAATGVAPARMLASADSASVCLSKGLGAPVGSLLVGTKAFIAKGRRVRKALGGGMRQAGVLAAAGIIALRDMWDRVADDHANARALAAGLSALPGVTVATPESNLVMVSFSTPGVTSSAVVAALRPRGIVSLPRTPTSMRLALHHMVSAADVAEVVAAFRDILPALAAAK